MIYSYRSIVGLDIHESGVRYVELIRGFRGIRLGGYGDISLSIGEAEIYPSRRELAIHVIRELIETRKIRSRKAVFGLSRDRYFFRKIPLPPVTKDQLAAIVENQIERFFPVRGDQLVYDYQEVGIPASSGQEVILVGARSADVEEILSIAKGAGLELLRIDMREASLLNLLRSGDDIRREPFLLLNLGKESAGLELVQNGCPVFIRSISSGAGGIGPEQVIRAIEDSLGFYSQSSKGEGRIAVLFVLGSPSGPPGQLFTEIERAFRLVVKPVDQNLLSVRIPPEFDTNVLAPALGLAFSGYRLSAHAIDILPRKVKSQRKRDEMIRMGVLSLIILFLVFAFFVAAVWRNQARLEEVKREIAAIEGKVNSVRELKKDYEGLINDVNSLNKLQGEKPGWLVILKNLSESIPEDAWLTSLEMEQGKPLRLSGNAKSAAKLIPLLEASPYLRNVKFEAPTTRRDFDGEEVETFRITADIDRAGKDEKKAE